MFDLVKVAHTIPQVLNGPLFVHRNLPCLIDIFLVSVKATQKWCHLLAIILFVFPFSEVITMYKNTVKECDLSQQKLREAESRLCSFQNSIRGLKKEMDILHKVCVWFNFLCGCG